MTSFRFVINSVQNPPVGRGVGLGVGLCVGESVGLFVGSSVAVGLGVGFVVGDSVGSGTNANGVDAFCENDTKKQILTNYIFPLFEAFNV